LQRKFIIISFLLLGLYFVPKTAVAQTIKDSIATAENLVADSITEIKSNEKEEDDKAVEKPPIEFIDARLDTTTLILRSSLNDSLEKVKKQAVYQYTPINEKLKNESKNNNAPSYDSFLSSSMFSFLFWLITIGCLVVVIVLYALDGNFKIFSGKAKPIQTTVEEDVFNQNIFDLDYAKLIQQATDNADYNRAVRLGFLKILTTLSSKKIIDYGVEKTNFDYQFQLIHTKYYHNFLLAANYYEYAWYAGIVINQNQYSKVLEGFKNLEQQIN